MPPKTSPIEVGLLLGAVVLAGLLHWYVRFIFSNGEVKRYVDKLSPAFSETLSTNCIQQIVAILLLRSANAVLSTLPFVGFWFGQTCTAILRDFGFIIFPWIILIGPLMFVVIGVGCESMRTSLISSALLAEARRRQTPINAFDVREHTDPERENPYAPPRAN